MLLGWYQCLCIYALNRPIPRRVMSVYVFMAKKATNSNEYFINKMRTAKCVSDNIVLGHGAWDYSFICLISGRLPETDTKIPGRKKAGELAAFLSEEVLRGIYRFRYSKAKDDIHVYVKAFLEDHQEGKLKRWIRDKISYSSLTERLLCEEQISLRDLRKLLIDEEAENI